MRERLKDYKRLEALCSERWNAFDPIGSVEAGIMDEYSAYIPKTVQLVMKGAEKQEFRAYIDSCVCEKMGLWGYSPAALDAFAQSLVDLAAADSSRRRD